MKKPKKMFKAKDYAIKKFSDPIAAPKPMKVTKTKASKPKSKTNILKVM